MSLIWTSRTRTEQPRGALRLANRYAGALFSAVASQPTTPVTRPNAATAIARIASTDGLSAGPGGPAWLVSSAAANHIGFLNSAGVDTGVYVGPTSWTLLIHCRIEALNGANPGFVRGNDIGGFGATFFIVQGGNQLPWVRVAGTNILQPASGDQILVGMDTVFVCSMKSGERVDVAWNGLVRHSATHSIAQTSDVFSYFGWQSSNTESVNGDYYSITWLPWAVSPAETAALSTPRGYYGEVFAPEQSPRFFSFANVLFSKLDETTASNTDYITTSTAGSVAEMQLGSVTDPGVDTLHSIKLRASGSGSLQVDLVQGSGALLTIWTSKTRTRQPQSITTASNTRTLNNGLVLLWSPIQDKNFRNAARNNQAATVTTDNTTLTLSKHGRALQHSGSSSQIVMPYGETIASGTAARITIGVITSWDEGPNPIIYAEASSGILTVATSWPDVTSVTWWGGGTAREIVIPGASEGVPWLTGYDGTNVWVGSQSVYQQWAETGAERSHNDARLYFGWDTQGTAPKTSLIAVWNRSLSRSEQVEWASNPWQLFAPESWPQHIPAAKPIATRTIPLIATPTDYRRELLPAEAALITDYTDLRVRLRGV